MVSPVKVWRRQRKIRFYLGKEGTVISWTRIYSAPTLFRHIVPYTIVYVRFHDGFFQSGVLVDYPYEQIKKGMQVTMTLRKVKKSLPESVISYTIVFRPL